MKFVDGWYWYRRWKNIYEHLMSIKCMYGDKQIDVTPTWITATLYLVAI